ncbi:GIY-YIG nuclease family protein [Sulfurovum sp. bin170]|uniref:GIY-YIG nuclease family protein n=1 Tax=Sulfurovum sp. bin170 TaxID=2695268 RepID=UPI0013E0E86C|nr:GIY-YIG nuclease family protein [Sulfurovum sp. bin170]NEW60103.1 GIY-YIG nuclease family protein [Sulfurovum sp. bin170]
MAKFSLDDILNEDPLGLLSEAKAKNPVVTANDRLLASFEEINLFVEKNGHEPKRSLDMTERGLYARLQGIREDGQKVEALQKYDRFNLLQILEAMALASYYSGLKPPIPMSIDDILNDDILGLLSDNTEDIFTLKNVPKTTTMPDYVASRKRCKNFDKFEELFKKCQVDLKIGKRRLIKFQNEQQIREGYYFVLKGILLFVASVGESQKVKGKTNARLRLIFENGTESDMLLRSLSAELYKDGKRVTEYDESKLGGLYSITDDDKQSGYIYVLKSLSSDDRIATKRNLYKIGFSKGDVKERIKNARNEPTYLMADVAIVDIYQCFNMNSQKLEQLLHKFFGKACLNIEIFDNEAKRHSPREWFIAPIDVIEEAIRLLISNKIIDYSYDVESETIINE